MLKLITGIILTFLSLTVTTLSSRGQSRISGRINTITGPLDKATIQLVNDFNQKEIYITTSNSEGTFTITKLPQGKYYLTTSFVGYQTYSSGILEVNPGSNLDLGTINMFPSVQTLEEITITAQKQTIEQIDGKLIINLKNSSTAGGSSALEVLERLPYISVDRQSGSISLKGKDGTLVMINGKKTYMSNTALMQLLSGTSASKIDKLELMTNASSAFDAEGTGIVNIVLNRSMDNGFNGSVDAQAGYGKNNVYNLNVDFNYKRNKLSIYNTISFSRQHQDQISFNLRDNISNNNTLSIQTHSNRDPIQRNKNLRFGMDYRFTQNANISGSIFLYDNRWSMDALNKSDFLIGLNSGENLSIKNTEINQWQHIGGNIDFQRKLKRNTSLDVSLDYLYYYDNNPTDYHIIHMDGNDKRLSESNTKSSKKTPIEIFVPQVTYGIYTDSLLDIKVGGKASVSRFNNAVSVSSLINNTWVNDIALTTNSKLDESIVAAFVEGSYNINEKTKVRGGVRYEQTFFQLTNTPHSNINKKYGSFFPSLLLSHTVNNNHRISFSYARRINRPSFNDIAPFVLFIDPYTFFAGNPEIQPSYTHASSVDYSIFNLLLSAGYSYENNSLAKFQISVNPVSNLQTVRPENLDYSKTFNSGVTIPFDINSWWSTQSTLNTLWQRVGVGAFQNNRVLTQWSLQFSGLQRFKFPKNLSAELSGFYNSTTLAGGSEIQPYGGLNFGFQKKLDRAMIRFNINDVFNSIKSTALVKASGFNIRNGYDFSQRTFKISWLYHFGKQQTAGNKGGKGAQEEKRRVE